MFPILPKSQVTKKPHNPKKKHFKARWDEARKWIVMTAIRETYLKLGTVMRITITP